MMQLLVVIVAFTDRHATENLLHWANRLVEGLGREKPVRAVVWDNKGHNLVHIPSAVAYISSTRGNIGFGAAVNESVRMTRWEWDRLLLLNPDIVLNDQLFADIVSRNLSLPGRTIWAPQLLNEDGTAQTVENGLFMRSPWAEVLDIWGHASRSQSDNARYYLRGAVFSIDRSSFEQAGGFDSQFFLYGEEADLCFRLPDVDLLFDHEVQVIHGGSQGSRGKSWPALRYSLKARVRLQYRYNGTWAGAITAGAALSYYATLRLWRWLARGR